MEVLTLSSRPSGEFRTAPLGPPKMLSIQGMMVAPTYRLLPLVMCTLVQTLMERVYEFREQSLKAKHEVAALQEENKELKFRLEQVQFSARIAQILSLTRRKRRVVFSSAKRTLE